MLVVLFGGVALLLVTACVNVANLVLSRSATRVTEFAIRQSLGATRWRLVRQLLTEAAVLSMFGGTLAVVLAVWGTDLLVSLVPAGLDLPRTREIDISGNMLLFALLVTTVTAMLVRVRPVARIGPLGGSGAARDRARLLLGRVPAELYRQRARRRGGRARALACGRRRTVEPQLLGVGSRGSWIPAGAGDDAARHASSGQVRHG